MASRGCFFVLAASSFIGLLVAEGRERSSRWGRSMGFSEREVTTHAFVGEVETGAIARVGRRIGAAAVCLAVAVPVVIPVIDGGLFGGGIGPNGPGGRQIVVGDPFVDLVRDLQRDDPVDLFSYETAGPEPGLLPDDHARLVRRHRVAADRAPAAGQPDHHRRRSRMRPRSTAVRRRRSGPPQVTFADNFASQWLPLPYPATDLAIEPGRWVYDAESLNVFGIDNTTAGATYRVVSRELDYDAATPTERGSRRASSTAYLELPDLPA